MTTVIEIGPNLREFLASVGMLLFFCFVGWMIYGRSD